MIPKYVIGKRRFDVRFKNGEDSLFMFLISDKFKYVEFTDEKAIYYRRFRKESASGNNRNIKYLFSNSIKLMKEQSVIYFCSPRHYSFIFYMNMMFSRIKICIRIFFDL